MPKLKPLTESQRHDAALATQIWGTMKMKKITGEKMAEMIGISKNTFYRKVKFPETFTLREIRALKKIIPEIVIE